MTFSENPELMNSCSSYRNVGLHKLKVNYKCPVVKNYRALVKPYCLRDITYFSCYQPILYCLFNYTSEF